MTLQSVRGQVPAVRIIERALATGRIHHAYRFEGPSGVGKEKLAFAFAQALLCERTDGTRAACGECASCERVVTFADEAPHVPLHPDVLLVQLGLYPKEVLGAKQTETGGIGLPQIKQVVMARAGMPPHEGRATVCIIRDADEFTIKAANALLKTLEEPRKAFYFVLLTDRPARLLDTIRSRTLPVRFGPLPEAVVASILTERNADPGLAALAEGSAALALELAEASSSDGNEDGGGEVVSLGPQLRASLDERTPAGALGCLDAKGDRHALRKGLTDFAHDLAVRARQSVEDSPDSAARLSRQFSLVLTARDQLERNAAPALCLESLALNLRRA